MNVEEPIGPTTRKLATTAPLLRDCNIKQNPAEEPAISEADCETSTRKVQNYTGENIFQPSPRHYFGSQQ